MARKLSMRSRWNSLIPRIVVNFPKTQSHLKMGKPDKKSGKTIGDESNEKFRLLSLIHYLEVSVINLALRDKSLNLELSRDEPRRGNNPDYCLLQTDYRWPYCRRSRNCHTRPRREIRHDRASQNSRRSIKIKRNKLQSM